MLRTIFIRPPRILLSSSPLSRLPPLSSNRLEPILSSSCNSLAFVQLSVTTSQHIKHYHRSQSSRIWPMDQSKAKKPASSGCGSLDNNPNPLLPDFVPPEGYFSDKFFGFGETKPLNEEGFMQFLEQINLKKAAYAKSLLEYQFDERRARCINGLPAKRSGGYRGVSFWMFRDQRVDDNWALIYAQKFALLHKCPLYVTFFLMSHYSVAGTRQYYFMLKGLQQVEKRCQSLGIQFHLRLGYAKDIIDEYCKENEIDLVIADFMPLRDPKYWVEEAGRKLKKQGIPLFQVDAHNVIPAWVTLDREAFGARSLRPIIERHTPEFLTEIPAMNKHPYSPKKPSRPADWNAAWAYLKIDTTIKPVRWARPGPIEGFKMLYEFISQRLERYDDDRNIPTKHALSCLSAYTHFGQLSNQRAILAVSEMAINARWKKSVDAWVEEALVRRELADNFCFYQPNYDNYEAAYPWSKKSHAAHRRDKREWLYSQEDLQFARTHDKCWNAAQVQLVQEGKMHGYLRMYWAKKILEWTPCVEEAIRIGIWLNDKYMLDGRDPNGYVGVMWAMVGTHDTGWTERPIVGKMRYMTYAGCARKFDVDFLARTYKAPIINEAV